MLWLKRGYFWLAMVTVTLAALLLALPCCLGSALYGRLTGRDPARGLRGGIWLYGRVFRFLVAPILPVISVNPDLAQRHSPCIIIPNHQSFLDLYLLSAQRCTNLCFVITAWPFTRLFFFAAVMRRARYIKVGRGEDSLDFLDRCLAELRAGSTLVCFPEGTRSRSRALLPFRSGIFRVAAAAGAKLVPMIFHNTGKICPPGSFKVNPQEIFVKLLEPIGCEQAEATGRNHKTLLQQARAAMLAELDKPTVPPITPMAKNHPGSTQ